MVKAGVEYFSFGLVATLNLSAGKSLVPRNLDKRANSVKVKAVILGGKV